jgi:hypothetical protein
MYGQERQLSIYVSYNSLAGYVLLFTFIIHIPTHCIDVLVDVLRVHPAFNSQSFYMIRAVSI